MSIRERDFRGVDLNLLVTLFVLLREKSVSKAADRLHLGQPAVSGALTRLRELFGDDLLVRTKSGMRPTPKALELERALGPALEQIQAALKNEPDFDCREAERTFIVGMPDWVDTWLLAPLVARLREEAPGIRIAAVATDRFRVTEMLSRDEIDLAIGAFDEGPGWQKALPLRTVHYRCVFRRGILPPKGKLTLKTYLDLPHLLVSHRGSFRGVVDDELESRGMARQVIHNSVRFSSLPAMLQRLAAIATVPEVLVPSWSVDFNLVSRAPPIDIPAMTVAIVLNRTRENDQAIRWLCGIIAETARLPAR